MRNSSAPSPENFLDLVRDPVRFFAAVSERGGPVAEIRLGWRRFYLMSDPDIIRDMLMTKSQDFEKFPQIRPEHSIFGKGLLTSEGAAHREQRRLLQPAFNRDRIGAYAEQMVKSTERAAFDWCDGMTLDVGQAMNRLTLDIVAKSMFALADFTVAEEIGGHVQTMLHMVNQLVMPWGNLLLYSGLPVARRYWRASRRLNELIARLVSDAATAPDRSDLVRMLIDTVKADGTRLSAMEIRDELITVIVAGHETVANGLAWCLYLLAKNPAIQEELRLVTKDVLQDRNPTAEDFSRLTRLEHAFAEALRLYPPIWILGRRALRPYAAGDFSAPKGSVLLVCMANLHRRAEFFPNPGDFKPERWQNPSWPAYAYIPFGGGVRRCIGERFAWMEGTLCLATMLRAWSFSLVTQDEPQMKAELALQPKQPLLLRLTRVSEARRVQAELMESQKLRHGAA